MYLCVCVCVPVCVCVCVCVCVHLCVHLCVCFNETLKPAAPSCSFATLMVYKIPKEDVQSLAKSFSQLESGESHCTLSLLSWCSCVFTL